MSQELKITKFGSTSTNIEGTAADIKNFKEKLQNLGIPVGENQKCIYIQLNTFSPKITQLMNDYKIVFSDNAFSITVPSARIEAISHFFSNSNTIDVSYPHQSWTYKIIRESESLIQVEIPKDVNLTRSELIKHPLKLLNLYD